MTNRSSKARSAFAFATLMLVASLTGTAWAGEAVTLEGNIVCAKCSMKEEGRDKCQNVLVVKGDEGDQHYYLAKNESSDEFGPVCMAKKPVRVTGTVSEKDGKSWLTASEIKPADPKG